MIMSSSQFGGVWKQSAQLTSGFVQWWGRGVAQCVLLMLVTGGTDSVSAVAGGRAGYRGMAGGHGDSMEGPMRPGPVGPLPPTAGLG